MKTKPIVYYARSRDKTGRQQTVQEHLTDVCGLCREYLESLNCGDTGEILGKFHDFGKYSARFAEVQEHRRQGVNHAFPGAVLLQQTYGNSHPVGAEILAAVVMSHHSSIQKFDPLDAAKCFRGTGDGTDRNGKEYSLFGKDDFHRASGVFMDEVPLPPRKFSLPVSMGKYADPYERKLEKMLCVRMLLSALADADYTDAAAAFDAGYLRQTADRPLDANAAMERLLTLREEKGRLSNADSGIDALRRKLFDDCLEAGKGPAGLYTLTAPTGLGKTLSLMAFALRHCQEHPQMRRVILLLPFLAIAKQNAADYRRILPELLESHSAAEWTEETAILSERWSPSCIITTNVGFFEPLFADSAVNVRRLHQIANSVIVLDEAQSLPPFLLNATLKTIRSLCENYGCTFVFSTATQPHFASRPGLGEWNPTEIVPDPQSLFDATRRVRYEWRTERKTPFCEIARELAASPSGCVIVNLRKHASLLYDEVCRCRNEDEVFLLSTDLCQAHREEVIQTVRDRLAEGLPTLLISTQCIEAGVDLDFPLLYRALAPLEAIIQAAGRVNRNGKLPTGGRVVVFIPDEPGTLYPKGTYYETAANCVLTLLSRHPIDCSDLSHIREYYELLYPYDGGDKHELTDSIGKEDYKGTAGAYKIIENGGVSVIVPWQANSNAMELYKSIRERYDKEGLTAGLMADARPIAVTSFEADSVKSLCQPLTFRSPEDGDQPKTGWYLLGIPENYQDKKGLVLSAGPTGLFG